MPTVPCSTPAGARDLLAGGGAEPYRTSGGFIAPLQTPAAPTWFSRSSGHVAGPAPQLGADTAQVLEELGLVADVEEAAADGSA